MKRPAAVSALRSRIVDLVIGVLVAGAAFGVAARLGRRRPGLLLAGGPVAVAVLGAAAAAGAAFAEAAPTALPAADVVLRAALAATVTAAASRAQPSALLIASAVTVVAGRGASLDWLAFVATGATMAVLALGRPSGNLGAIIGACLAQVLLRLELGGITGSSATVAAAVAGLLIVSGLRRTPDPTRRHVRTTVGVLAGAAVVVSGVAILAATGAAGDVRRGTDAGKDGLRAAGRGDVPGAKERFDHAADAFNGAAAELSRWWVKPALAVPVLGHQLRAVQVLSEAGEQLARAAATVVSEVDRTGLRIQGGAIDLAGLERAANALAATGRRLDRAVADVESARSPWLVAPLVDAINDFDTRMAEGHRAVGTTTDVLELAGAMLGRDGPRRWFLAVVTPAESRGSGGLVGNIGEITAERGKVDLVAVERIAQLNEAVDDKAAAQVLPMLYQEAYPGWNVPTNLQNVTVAADFPTAAIALESVLPLAGRGEVDGTISIDPLAVAALLEATGPVEVRSWPVPLTSVNAAEVLLHEQYVALEQDPREQFLVEVIRAVWDRLTSGDVSPVSLSRALAPAVAGRHIQLHSRRPDEQATLSRLGADGAMHRTGVDHLSLVTNNASESKADWFLRRAVDYRVRYDPGSGSAEATVIVTLTNDAPSSGLPEYVLGGQVVPPGTNRQIVQIYTPLDILAASVDGQPLGSREVRSLGRSGNWAHEFDVAVPAKSAIRLELRLAGRLTGEPGRWILDIGRQPAIHPDDVSVTFEVADGWRIEATAGGLAFRGRTAEAQIDLHRNVQLRVQMIRG